MIIVQLKGGMGNQMFQYAMGRALSLRNKTDFKLDVGALENPVINVTPRKYALGCFDIKEKFASATDLKAMRICHRSKIGTYLDLVLVRLFGKRGNFRVIEPAFNFQKDLVAIDSDAYLEGQWTTEKYFKDWADIIRDDFKLKSEFSVADSDMAKKIAGTNSIAIHLRRGDYVKNPKVTKFHGQCSPEYYEKAVKYLAGKISQPTLFVFSDDIRWVRENLKTSHPTEYVSDGKRKDYEELILMSLCKHNIIANSTFSWWGAWLNANPEKVVIAPKFWFANKRFDTSDVIPENWIRM